jgi:hypothetical protein
LEPAVAIVAGYPLQLPSGIELDVGAAVDAMAVPFTTTTNRSGSMSLVGIMADAGASYELLPKLAARADVGAGLRMVTGLEKDGNPFTMDGSAATGVLSSFVGRVSVSADYAVRRNLLVTATPLALTYSPAPGGFDSSISSLTSWSFLAGVAYRQ